MTVLNITFCLIPTFMFYIIATFCLMTYYLFVSTEPAWSPDPGDFLGVGAVRGNLHLYRH